MDGQAGNEKRRKRRRWGRKARSVRCDESDVSPLISSEEVEEEEEEESGVMEQAHVRGRRCSRKMGGVDDGAEVSIRSALGRHKEVVDEGRRAKRFFFRSVLS